MEKIVANYEIFPSKAQEIEGYGNALYTNIKTAMDKLLDLNHEENWQGVKYGELIDAINLILPGLDDIIKDVATDIPNSLRAKATNYGNFDTSGNFSAGTSEDAKKVGTLEVQASNILKFNKDVVESTNSKIVEELGKAKENITSAKNVVSGMINAGDWAGEAADSTITKISSYEQTVNGKIDELISDIDNAFKGCVAELESDETANTEDAV